ncbi:outer membrane beta-barrel protein [Candidatus Avelusimicrobium alvi]|uniref:outer membrane beta-barrel protein n=1 Tax=Candidatus Avelusimicrobium alvi TaxID=3416221 RepID=UPI003D0B8714
MKRSVFAICLVLAAAVLQAETIKMKDGELISGSILSQTEYTLNLATSYGNITLNQREIEAILPDKHRLILKGGTQLVGVILDLDEFNLKLQTDDGAVVNVDMPQIVSIETYDYDRGENAQKEFVEKNLERQQAAAERAAATAAQQNAAQAGAPAVVPAAGGLTFDSDIDQVFDAQKATVVNGSVVTPSARVEVPAPRPMTDEEAFIKGVKTGEVSQQDYAAAAKNELSAKKTAKKEAAKPAAKPKEKDFNKYFAVEAGVMPLDLKLDNSARDGYTADDNSLDVGGTSAIVSSKFMWRIKESNFWAGPMFAIANISNNSFADKDPNVKNANDTAVDPSDPPYPDPKVKTSGQILTIGAAANYYLNPAGRFVFYLTASAAYEMLTLNYRGEMQSDTIKSNGFAGGAGIGVETLVDDVMIGVEARQVFAQRSGELKNSSSSNTVIQARLSWKF